MVLTDEEEILNLAFHVDADTLNIVDGNGDPDPSKFAEILAESLAKGLSNADTFAPSIDWTSPEGLSHPSYDLYKEIAILSAAAYMLRPLPDYAKTVEEYEQTIELKGNRLRRGIKEAATYGTDSGASKARLSSSANVIVTYPKNFSATPFMSPNFKRGRRGRI